jgi:hypothetical protein
MGSGMRELQERMALTMPGRHEGMRMRKERSRQAAPEVSGEAQKAGWKARIAREVIADALALAFGYAFEKHLHLQMQKHLQNAIADLDADAFVRLQDLEDRLRRLERSHDLSGSHEDGPPDSTTDDNGHPFLTTVDTGRLGSTTPGHFGEQVTETVDEGQLSSTTPKPRKPRSKAVEDIQQWSDSLEDPRL